MKDKKQLALIVLIIVILLLSFTVGGTGKYVMDFMHYAKEDISGESIEAGSLDDGDLADYFGDTYTGNQIVDENVQALQDLQEAQKAQQTEGSIDTENDNSSVDAQSTESVSTDSINDNNSGDDSEDADLAEQEQVEATGLGNDAEQDFADRVDGIDGIDGSDFSDNEDEISDSVAENVSEANDFGKDSAPQYIEYRFRNAKLKNQHYEKHGIEMGFASADAYEIAAADVANSREALHKLEAEDGDDVYYIERTNEFVIVSKDGYLRTYFNPSRGIDYYNRQ